MATHLLYEANMSQQYELRKLLTNEKISHETTLKQLQSSYQINQELQNTIKTLNNQANAIRKQLSQKTNKLNKLGETYEEQILELKDAINVRDNQLATLRASLVVTDYDMIRLRVINQLQITHKQETNALEQEIKKLQSLLLHSNKQRQIDKAKIEHLKEQNLNVINDYQIKLEERERSYQINTNKMIQKIQCEKRCRKEQERLLQKANKRYDDLMKKYEQQLSQAYEEYQPKINDNKIGNNQSFVGTSKNASRIYNDFTQKQQQFQNYKTKTIKQTVELKNKISQLEKQIRQTMINYVPEVEHQRKLKEKDEEIDNLTRNLQRSIRIIKNEWQEDVKKIKKNYQSIIEQLKNQKISEKQNNRRQNITESDDFGAKVLIKSLEKRNKQLENEIQTLKQKINQLKNSQGTRKMSTQRQGNVAVYKNKLKQANAQIVTLLKQKIMLKQQIQQLRK